MGRKPKCTVEEKLTAVEDYLNGIRSVSEIKADLAIGSTRTVRDWILAYQHGGAEALCPVSATEVLGSGNPQSDILFRKTNVLKSTKKNGVHRKTTTRHSHAVVHQHLSLDI